MRELPLQISEEKYVRGWRGPNKRKTRDTLCLATPQHRASEVKTPFFAKCTTNGLLRKDCTNWRARLREKSHIDLGLLTEDLAKGHNSPWLTWRSLNRLRTGYTCSKEQRKKWKYYDGDTTCVCGLATEITAHLLQCSLLIRPCTLDDLLEFNDTGREWAERWKKTV